MKESFFPPEVMSRSALLLVRVSCCSSGVKDQFQHFHLDTRFRSLFYQRKRMVHISNKSLNVVNHFIFRCVIGRISYKPFKLLLICGHSIFQRGFKVDLRDWLGGCGVDSPGSGKGSLAGCCEHGDEPSGSGATELVSVFRVQGMC
jgi:hypothetical protein